MQLIFFDELNNTVSIQNEINLLENFSDIHPPDFIIKTYDENSDSIYEIISFDSVLIEKIIVSINDNNIIDTTSSLVKFKIHPENFNANSLLKIQVFDGSNFQTKVFVINENFIEPKILKTNISDSLINNNNTLYTIPEKIIFYLNNATISDSLIIILCDSENNKNTLSGKNISDTVIECNTEDFITTSENFSIELTGKDKNDLEYKKELNTFYFKVLSKSSNSIIKKHGVNLNISSFKKTGVDYFWVSIENLSSNDPKIKDYIDSSMLVLPESSQKYFEISLNNETGEKLYDYSGNFLMKVFYTDEDNDGKIDGANNLLENNLYLTTLDSSKFIKLTESEINSSENYCYTSPPHFSIWALSYNGSGTNLKESLKIYPSGRFTDNINNIINLQFFWISGKYRFKIFSKNGSLVKSYSKLISGSNTEYNQLYREELTLTDNNGRNLKTGTYYFFIKAPNGEKYIKPFSIIR